MELTVKKLWNRDFSLLVIGQIMSIFGNMILSFALPLYILDISESAAHYGFVLAVPYVSLVLISPFGGIIADRLRKLCPRIPPRNPQGLSVFQVLTFAFR